MQTEGGAGARLRSATPCVGEESLRFTVFLKQQNLDKLELLLHKVSDPKSESYGHFLSKHEVDELVRATPEAHSTVFSWLSQHGVTDITARADAIAVNTSCEIATRLFQAPFHFYEPGAGVSGANSLATILIAGEASITAELAEHVSFVMGLSELWEGKQARRQSPVFANVSASTSGARKNQSASVKPDPARSSDASALNFDLQVTPQLLREWYNVPDESNAADKNLQAVTAFDQDFSQGAFELFYQNVMEKTDSIPKVEKENARCLAPGGACEQESDLDVQYLTAMAGSGSVKTKFQSYEIAGGWLLGFSQAALEMSPLPMVFSISYGLAELDQCLFEKPICDKLGYSSEMYVERTNTNFQKMGVMGSSLIVSSGDSGATSRAVSGLNPIDSENCYAAALLPMGETEDCGKCNQVLVIGAIGEECVYPTQIQSMEQQCAWLADKKSAFTRALQEFKQTNAACGVELKNFQTRTGSTSTVIYSTCECADLKRVKGVDLDDVSVGPAPDLSTPEQFAKVFKAEFPAGSPYVTAVGATIFASYDGSTVSGESVASIKSGSIITSGGGFSKVADAPVWQKDVLQAYQNNSSIPKPPTTMYDISKRGVPDVALSGHNYKVLISQSNPPCDVCDQLFCPCFNSQVDGTSASAPAFAGMISMINGRLLAAGKPQLGFLNPMLYSAYATDHSIFKDITVGDNKCTEHTCMKFGFTAGEGWDPVTGLGSINFDRLASHLGIPNPPGFPMWGKVAIAVACAVVAALCCIGIYLRTKRGSQRSVVMPAGTSNLLRDRAPALRIESSA